MSDTAHWSNALLRFDACSEAVDWASTQPDPQTAWQRCKRGDWMLWLAGRRSGGPGSDARRPLVLAACECARLSLHFVKDGEDRPRIAIETAEAWARGGDGAPTLDEVRAAAEAAAAYSYSAASAAAEDAASAAYAATYVSYACADDCAADAASSAASDAATAYASYDAAANASAAAADIVRKHYPTPPELREADSE